MIGRWRGAELQTDHVCVLLCSWWTTSRRSRSSGTRRLRCSPSPSSWSISLCGPSSSSTSCRWSAWTLTASTSTWGRSWPSTGRWWTETSSTHLRWDQLTCLRRPVTTSSFCFKFISRALKEESWRECWSQPTVGIISDESDLLIRLNAVLKRKKKKQCLNSNKRIYSDVCEKLPSLPQTSSCIHVNTLTYRWIIDYLFSVAVGLFACVWHFYMLHANQQRNKERDISSDWMLRERKRRCGTTNWGRSKPACEPRVAPAAVRDSDDRLDQID